MNEREPAALSSRDRSGGRDDSKRKDENDERKTADAPVAFADPEGEGENLVVQLIDEPELRSGQAATLQMRLTRPGHSRRQPVANAVILVKMLGTTFRPQSLSVVTDDRGLAVVSTVLPEFQGGRAAILVKAESNGETAELRRIILPADS
jgi:hypothetical protein